MTDVKKSPAEALGAAADLRDQFAMAALMGMPDGSPMRMARLCYEIADAMLVVRKEPIRGGEA